MSRLRGGVEVPKPAPQTLSPVSRAKQDRPNRVVENFAFVLAQFSLEAVFYGLAEAIHNRATKDD